MDKKKQDNDTAPTRSIDNDQGSQDRSRQGQDQQKNQLNKEDIPESTNESKGTTGSGQRQDSN